MTTPEKKPSDAVRRLLARGRPPGANRPTLVRAMDDDPDFVPVGINAILAASEKLLAVNRGLVPPDARDSWSFKTVLTPDKLLRERIRLDADKVRLNLLRRVARTRNLAPVGAGAFDRYAEGLLVGNPLSQPLEEINPMHLVEQARRVTQMGPGGLPSDDSITAEAQALHPSQFGFLSTLEGPESSRAGVDTRLAHGARIGSDGRIYQKFHDRRAGVDRWVSPVDLEGKTVALPD